MAFFSSEPAKTINVNTQTPQQISFQKRLLEILGPHLDELMQMSGMQQPQAGGIPQGMINPQNMGGFSPIAAQANMNFQNKTIPSIMERFAATNSLESSALPQMLGAAGSELNTNLGALGANYNLQQQGQQQNTLMNLLGYAMNPSFQPIYQPRQPSMIETAAPYAAQAALTALLGVI